MQIFKSLDAAFSSNEQRFIHGIDGTRSLAALRREAPLDSVHAGQVLAALILTPFGTGPGSTGPVSATSMCQKLRTGRRPRLRSMAAASSSPTTPRTSGWHR